MRAYLRGHDDDDGVTPKTKKQQHDDVPKYLVNSTNDLYLYHCEILFINQRFYLLIRNAHNTSG